MAEKKAEGPNVITLEVAAALIKVTPRRVQQLVKEGWIKKSGRGGYPLLSVVHGYVDFLQDEARRSAKSASASRVTDARTKEIELRILERSRTLVTEAKTEALTLWDELHGGLVADLLSVPARVTSDIAIRSKIEAAIDDALRAAAKRTEAARQPDEASGAVADAGAEVDA